METAVITADGPGSGIISILFLLHSLIKIFPGSEIVVYLHPILKIQLILCLKFQ